MTSALPGTNTNTGAPAAAFGLDRVGQIAVIVHDVARATRFYRDALGMRLLFEAPPGLAFFDCGGVRLLLSAPERAEDDHPSSVIYFVVDDLPAAYRTFSARGVQFTDEPHLIATMPDHELWMAFFTDSEANTLALMSEVPRHEV